MNGTAVTFPQRGMGETSRTDLWWVKPLAVFLGLSFFFLGYLPWAMLQGDNYWFGNYLSPVYSPELWGDSPHALFGPGRPPFWPQWLIYTPGLLILWMPGGFRFTCYYYRGAYYKAFWADPPACAVGEPRKSYLGEKSFPLIIQNIHRYFMYIAVAFLFFLAYDAWHAMWFDNGAGGEEFGIGVGTLVITMNFLLLSSYTLGCHSFRHMIGGRLTRISKNKVRYSCYEGCTALNKKHQLFAWMSLFWVAFTDFYIRMCAMGVFHDVRIF
jgi:hypothetical protein